MNRSSSSSRKIRGKKALKEVLQNTPKDTPVILKDAEKTPFKRKQPTRKSKRSMVIQNAEDGKTVCRKFSLKIQMVFVFCCGHSFVSTNRSLIEIRN